MKSWLFMLILLLSAVINVQAKPEVARVWTESERQQIEKNLERMKAKFAENPLPKVDIYSGREFVFFAHFDDTSPAKDRLRMTVVADLHSLMIPNENSVSAYYPGRWEVSADVSKQMRASANSAYEAFSRDANNWLRKHPEAEPASALKIMATGYGRGGVSMALFSQLLYADGLVDDESGKTLVPPGVLGLSGGMVYDLVDEGYSGNTAFAPTSKNITELQITP